MFLKFSREVAMATSGKIRRCWHMVWEVNSIAQIHVPQNVFLVIINVKNYSFIAACKAHM